MRSRVADTSTCSDADKLAAEAARRIAEYSLERLQKARFFTIGLAGGSTPQKTYERLAEMKLDWDRWRFFFGDERCVRPDDPDSNFAMAEQTFFSKLAISPVQVWRMEGEAEDPEAAARRYGRYLPDALDLLLLGMGEDGHTASLFPGSAAAGEKVERVLAVTGPKPPPRRLTITPAVITSARKVIMLVSGESKAEMVRKVWSGPEDPWPWDLPAKYAAFFVQSGCEWLLDEAAAGKK